MMFYLMIISLSLIALGIAVVGAVLIALVVNCMLSNNSKFGVFYSLLVLFIATCTFLAEYGVCKAIKVCLG